jgi:hypothetical protein
VLCAVPIGRDTTIRFCAKWRNLLHAHAPPLLRLRLICMSDLDADLADPTLRKSMKDVVAEERSTWLSRNESLDIYSRTHIEWRTFLNSPEFAALLIAHRLFADGHHAQFLFGLNRFWMWALSKLENLSSCQEDELEDILTIFDDVGFSFNKWRLRNRMREFWCYLPLSKSSDLGVSDNPHLKKVEATSLPTDVQLIVRGSTIPTADPEGAPQSAATAARREYVAEYRTTALDAPSAVEDFILALLDVAKLNRVLSGPKYRKKRAVEGLASDARIVIRSDAGEPSAFAIVNRLQTEVIALDSEKKRQIGSQLQQECPSFSSLIDVYAAATMDSQRGDVTKLFKTISLGLDNVLLPVASVRRPHSNIDLIHIPGIAAKMLALDALRNIFGSLCRAVANRNLKSYVLSNDLSFAAMKQLRVNRLGEELEAILERNIYTGQAFDMAWFIARRTSKLPLFLQALATRYYFDLKRCMQCRNEIVHRGRDKTNEYLGNIMLQLVRLVIEFRVATFDILPLLQSIDARIKSLDDAFGAAVRLMAADFDALVGHNSALGVRPDPTALVHAGWGTWAAGTLPHALATWTRFSTFPNSVAESINRDEAELARVQLSSELLL